MSKAKQTCWEMILYKSAHKNVSKHAVIYKNSDQKTVEGCCIFLVDTADVTVHCQTRNPNHIPIILILQT